MFVVPKRHKFFSPFFFLHFVSVSRAFPSGAEQILAPTAAVPLAHYPVAKLRYPTEIAFDIFNSCPCVRCVM
jgi:hypothetical protein